MSDEKNNFQKKDKKTEAAYKHTQITNYGMIKVDEDVIAGIAAHTVSGVEGVAERVGGMTDGISEMLGKKIIGKGVKVDYIEKQLVIDLNVLVFYGYQIPVVARAIQEAVFASIQQMLGLDVYQINVFVQGIVFKPDEKNNEE